MVTNKIIEWTDMEGFQTWMAQRKSNNTTKTYGYWRKRMIQEQGLEANIETMLNFYDRYPKPVVRGMLQNLSLFKRISITIPTIRRTKKFNLPKVYSEETKQDLVYRMKTNYSPVLWVMAECGLRISEALGIRITDLNEKDQTITVSGKGDKERLVYPSPELFNALKGKYKENKYGYLWSSPVNDGEPIRPHTIRKHLRRLLFGSTPHRFRHTYATELYRATKDLRLVQNMLGHSNITTTTIYTHLVDEQKAEAAKIVWMRK
jgi:integrase